MFNGVSSFRLEDARERDHSTDATTYIRTRTGSICSAIWICDTGYVWWRMNARSIAQWTADNGAWKWNEERAMRDGKGDACEIRERPFGGAGCGDGD